MSAPETIGGKTLVEWQAFARRDDCLDKMVPSDLRQLIALAFRADLLPAAQARAERAEAALATARDGLKCAAAIMDTPIARRRLGLEADDERLMVFRAALAALKGGAT